MTSGADYQPPDMLHGLGPGFTLVNELGTTFIAEQGTDGADALYEALRERPLPRRYRLRRQFPNVITERRVCLVCGLNPSTATAVLDDATIRRCTRFAWAWGCHTYVMVNAYSWRATKPADMWRQYESGSSIVGPYNDRVIIDALRSVKRTDGIAVAAWGTHCQPERASQLIELAREVGVQWQCLGYNAAGSPKHPLYVANGTPLVPWPRVVEGDVYVDLAEPTDGSERWASSSTVVPAGQQPQSWVVLDEDVFDGDD